MDVASLHCHCFEIISSLPIFSILQWGLVATLTSPWIRLLHIQHLWSLVRIDTLTSSLRISFRADVTIGCRCHNWVLIPLDLEFYHHWAISTIRHHVITTHVHSWAQHSIQGDPNGAVLCTLSLPPEWGGGLYHTTSCANVNRVVVPFRPFWVSSAKCNPEQTVHFRNTWLVPMYAGTCNIVNLLCSSIVDWLF